MNNQTISLCFRFTETTNTQTTTQRARRPDPPTHPQNRVWPSSRRPPLAVRPSQGPPGARDGEVDLSVGLGSPDLPRPFGAGRPFLTGGPRPAAAHTLIGRAGPRLKVGALPEAPVVASRPPEAFDRESFPSSLSTSRRRLRFTEVRRPLVSEELPVDLTAPQVRRVHPSPSSTGPTSLALGPGRGGTTRPGPRPPPPPTPGSSVVSVRPRSLAEGSPRIRHRVSAKG